MAAILGCGSLAVFAAMSCPTIYVQDSAEFATAAAIFGVPHPPGYPLFTLLSGLFVHAVRVGDMGARSNLFSAVCGALTVVALWLFLLRLGISRLAALAAVLCFSFGPTFWSQCLAAEVHTFNCLLLVLTLLATLETARRPTAGHFALCGLAMGIAVGHRNLNLFYVLPLIVALEAARRRTRTRARLFVFTTLAAAATGIIYLYLPIAGWHDPPLYVGAPSTLGRLYSVVSAQAYLRHVGSGTAATDAHRVVMFLTALPAELGMAAAAAPVGFWLWRRRQGRVPLAVALYLLLACIGFSAFYNVIDVQAYFLPAHIALAVGAAVAFDAVPGLVRWALPVVALGGLPLHFGSVNLRYTTAARGYGVDLMRSAPTDAVVIPFADTSTHVLGFLQAVEGARPDVVVVSSNQITDWYVDDLRRRHPRVDWPADPDQGDWFMEFVRRNLGKRPVCLTEPLTLGISEWAVTSRGLLYCFGPQTEANTGAKTGAKTGVKTGVEAGAEPGAEAGAAARAEDARAEQLAVSIEFWRNAAPPSPRETAHADVHVRMLAFSYALARFTLARELVEAGAVDSARGQLREIIASAPDEQERAIAASMATIGRTIGGTSGRRFSLGARAQAALAMSSEDRSGLITALTWNDQTVAPANDPKIE
jgi:hypothetical protein